MNESLFQKLKEYGEGDAYPFHMPGHKRSLESGPLSSLYQYDITEIDDFDNLHQPEGILMHAQERAAGLYHSEETYFLINGSTSGILSAVSAVAHRGKKLIVARNCHKAVYHAAFLNRLEMEYIYPVILSEYYLADGINTRQVEQKIKEIAEKENISLQKISRTIAGIILTSPTYDGILSDVKGIVELAHRYDIPVIIDQAHGAHFGFHPSYPENAVREGADIVIHSVHKTLPAPTQTALLHRNGTLVDRNTVRKYLRIYQSSSPSYLLMAGIDTCMEILEKEGNVRLNQLLNMRKDFIGQIRKLQYIYAYPSMAECEVDRKDVWKSGMADPGRLVLVVKEGYLTGQELYDILRKKYHLQMEMCGEDYVVAILSMMDKKEGFDRLVEALTEIDSDIEKFREILTHKQEGKQFISGMRRPQISVPIWKAFGETGKELPLAEADGKIVTDFVNLYPPGIPLLIPGEKVDREMVELIEKYLKNGYTLQGISKSETGENVLRVIV